MPKLSSLLTPPAQATPTTAALPRVAVPAPQPPNATIPDVYPITDDWYLDLVGKRLLGSAGELSLSALAFRLLKIFVRHPHAVLTREQLLTAVWPPGFADTDHTVDQAIHSLRRVVEPDPAHPRYLCTRRGLGYGYCPPAPGEQA